MEDVEVEDGDDEEELYELASLQNGEISEVSSEAEGSQAEEQSEMSDSNKKDAASCQSEATLDHKRAIVDDIRCVVIKSFFKLTSAMSIADFAFFFLTGRMSLALVWN